MNQKHLRKISKDQHADFALEICQLLACNDPLGLAFYDDCEYESEARDIAARLPEVTSLNDVHNIIYDVFWDSFQPYRLAQENSGTPDQPLPFGRDGRNIWRPVHRSQHY
jgi:hypothetical protein